MAVLASQSVPPQQAYLVVACSTRNVGDVAHAQQLMKYLPQELSLIRQFDIDASEEPASLSEKYVKVLKEIGEGRQILLSIGELGLRFLVHLNTTKAIPLRTTFIAVGIHQYMPELSSLPLQYVAVPKATVDTPEKRAVIAAIPASTLTFAVPTSTPSQESLKEAYESWKTEKKPALDQPSIIVMLPGDAPDSTGTIRHFTEQSAKELFNRVYDLWKEQGMKHAIIVQNGPRTGKYKANSLQIACSHEYPAGGDPSVAEDEISRLFINLLKEKGVPHLFFNFAFEVDGKNKKVRSFFNPLLHVALSCPTNYFILPGESVSMLGQIPLYLPANRTVVFKPDSMNEAHMAIFKSAVERKYLSFFSEDGTIVSPENPEKRKEDDGALVAKELARAFQAYCARR